MLGDATQVSVTLNLHVTRPDNPDSADDVDAVRQIDAVGNRVFLGPMLEGAYPDDLIADTAHVTDWSFVQDGDAATAAVPLSVLGINYYSTSRARRYSGVGERLQADGHGDSDASAWVGADTVEFVPVPGPYTAMGWNIDPSGMSELLTGIGTRYPQVPLMVTENGAAFYDTVSADGRVHDVDRISYLHGHIDAVGAAREAGIDVRGYFLWSLLDNFEWGYGYDRRFGIIRVDYDTLERTVKDSARWYAELIRTGELPEIPS